MSLPQVAAPVHPDRPAPGAHPQPAGTMLPYSPAYIAEAKRRRAIIEGSEPGKAAARIAELARDLADAVHQFANAYDEGVAGRLLEHAGFDPDTFPELKDADWFDAAVEECVGCSHLLSRFASDMSEYLPPARSSKGGAA